MGPWEEVGMLLPHRREQRAEWRGVAASDEFAKSRERTGAPAAEKFDMLGIHLGLALHAGPLDSCFPL